MNNRSLVAAFDALDMGFPIVESNIREFLQSQIHLLQIIALKPDFPVVDVPRANPHL